MSTHRLAVCLAITPLLTGCLPVPPPLPDCITDDAAPPPSDSPTKVIHNSNGPPPVPGAIVPPGIGVNAKELLIGIDGSGSMLGHARAGNSSRWLSLLQSINLSAQTQGLSPRAYRIGAGTAQPLKSESVTAARNPCFFQGCAPYPAVASSLQTLWEVKASPGATPLRLLVSDLEVNQNDISTLIGAIRKDLDKGASAGVLALRLPFEGQVFNASGAPVFTGKLDRPVYMLATGNAAQVKAVLEEIRKNMALKGVSSQELSILDAQSEATTLTTKDVTPTPINQGSAGGSVTLNGARYNASNSPNYGFVKLSPGATGISLFTIIPWGGGTSRPDLGLLKLEAIPLAGVGTAGSGGIRLKSMSVAGSHLRLDLEIPPATPAGAFRATIPRGSLPEQWWIEWDKDDPKAANSKEKTEGLLLLMTTLGQQVQARSPNKAPAAALCFAFQHQSN